MTACASLFSISEGPFMYFLKLYDFHLSGPHARLDKLLSEPGNGLCADCGSYDPRWV